MVKRDVHTALPEAGREIRKGITYGKEMYIYEQVIETCIQDVEYWHLPSL